MHRRDTPPAAAIGVFQGVCMGIWVRLMAMSDGTRQREGGSDAQRPQSQYAILWRGSTLGLELVGSILIAGFIGWALDRWLGTSPWFLLACGTLGIVGGGLNFLRDAKRFAAAVAATGPRASRSSGVADRTSGGMVGRTSAGGGLDAGGGSRRPDVPAGASGLSRAPARRSDWFARQEGDDSDEPVPGLERDEDVLNGHDPASHQDDDQGGEGRRR